MRSAIALLAVMVLATALSAQAQPAESVGPYKIIKTAKVGGAGGFDYVFADSSSRKLFIPRGNRVTVYNLDTLASEGVIDNTRGVHGVAVDPQSGHGFSSSNPVVMFVTKSLATIKTIEVKGNPDGIFFEPATHRIYVLSHRTPNVSVLDAKDGSIVGTIDLGGAPEQGVSDGQGHVYIDIENQNNVAAVDANTMKVTAHYDLGDKGGGPAGLALDAKNHILFACCRNPQNMVILDALDGKVITTLPIGQGVDAAEFNPNTMEAFSSHRDGTLTIVKENSPTSFEVEQNLKTMVGAKTSSMDEKTNQIYLIAAEQAPARQGQGGQGQGRRGGRGQMVPDSFTILVAGK